MMTNEIFSEDWNNDDIAEIYLKYKDEQEYEPDTNLAIEHRKWWLDKINISSDGVDEPLNYQPTRTDLKLSAPYLVILNSGGEVVADVNDAYNFLELRTLSVYRYLWFEYDHHDSTLNVAIPNQANWGIDIYVNDEGELIINNDWYY